MILANLLRWRGNCKPFYNYKYESMSMLLICADSGVTWTEKQNLVCKNILLNSMIDVKND